MKSSCQLTHKFRNIRGQFRKKCDVIHRYDRLRIITHAHTYAHTGSVVSEKKIEIVNGSPIKCKRNKNLQSKSYRLQCTIQTTTFLYTIRSKISCQLMKKKMHDLNMKYTDIYYIYRMAST